MPLYVNVHGAVDTPVEDVVEAHETDAETRAKPGVRCLNYRMDEDFEVELGGDR